MSAGLQLLAALLLALALSAPPAAAIKLKVTSEECMSYT
jgi:hypothetical protein